MPPPGCDWSRRLADFSTEGARDVTLEYARDCSKCRERNVLTDRTGCSCGSAAAEGGRAAGRAGVVVGGRLEDGVATSCGRLLHCGRWWGVVEVARGRVVLVVAVVVVVVGGRLR